jgi:two-component system CheB/CheR fusion protein
MQRQGKVKRTAPRLIRVKAAQSARPARRAGALLKGRVRPQNDSLLVVGLGASAGGLEAVRKLLATLPAHTGMAFVLIQHLDPTHKSMLVDLLSRDTAMKVLQASDGMSIRPDCLYVIPPQADLSVDSGVLRLSQPPALRGPHLPFDFFLRSLAESYGERAVCVVLSGAGADGSVGLRAVSEKGGLVIAQDPGETAFDGMPRSAIATGAVDLVLPTKKIPRALIRRRRYPHLGAARKRAPPDDQADKSLTLIIELLRSQSSQDFTGYRKATVARRIQRRMDLAGIKEVDDYIKTLRRDGTELGLLAKDLLIHVTRFFRDPAAHEALAKAVIPEMVRRHAADRPIRIWVPGCSTGEEAYSLAMLFTEELASAAQSSKLQIFASDLSPDVVARGRNGVFPEAIKTDVSAERLARFFTREDYGYRVCRELRDSIVFTVQDLLTDPPFSCLDFISCRNLLIYLRPEEQEKVLSLFHFALQKDGVLSLGTSETVGKLTDRFEQVPNTVRVYRRIGASERQGRTLAPNIGEFARPLWQSPGAQAESKRRGLGGFAQQLLLETYAPAAALVSRGHQGLYFFGPIDRYLRVAVGEQNRLLPAMLRDGLAGKFQAAVRQASSDHAPVTVHGARVKRNGGYVLVSMSVRPVRHDGEDLVLVSFVDEPERANVVTVESPAETSRTEQLDQELENARQDLDSTISELNASNEQLTALNEEAVSLNEEFRSTNEELETSREELQSLNEELTTTNCHLRESLEQQRKSSTDLHNILNSSQIAILFLDADLRVRFFTPDAAPLFSLIASDLGRPLADLAIRFIGVDLLADARSVLTNVTSIQREIKSASGLWYLCSISPYRTETDRFDGVVINLADISDVKAGEERLLSARAYTSAVIDTIREPMVVLDGELRIEAASESFYGLFGGNLAENTGRLLTSLETYHLDTPVFRAFLDGKRATGEGAVSCEITIDRGPLEQRTLLATAESIPGAIAATDRILVSFNDVTDLKRAAQDLVTKQSAEVANLGKSRFLAAASHDLRQPLQTLSLLQGALRQRIRDKQSLALIAKADRTLSAMSATLNALLDINQLEAGVIRPKLTDVLISEILGVFKSEFAELATLKGLRWRVVSCGLTVRSDRHLLEEVIRNLLSNAVRYTDAGTILLGCRRQGHDVRIEVWDTGIGIAADQIPHIFQEYRRATDLVRPGSLGLGLAIVQQLAEVLGHPVGVRSTIGKGSVFSIEVPAAPAVSGVRICGSEKPSDGGTIRRAGTILVLEDDELVSEAIKLFLERDGHLVFTVATGEDALKQVTKLALRPDLVISDYNLAGTMTGVRAATGLRKVLGSQLPVVILTGDVRVAVLNDIAKHGYVSRQKPLAAEELLEEVQRLLGAFQSPPGTLTIAAPEAPGV